MQAQQAGGGGSRGGGSRGGVNGGRRLTTAFLLLPLNHTLLFANSWRGVAQRGGRYSEFGLALSLFIPSL